MANERVTRLYIKAVVILALLVLCGLVMLERGHPPLGLDLKGGSELRYRIEHEKVPESDRATITRDTINVIRRRVDPQGNKGIEIRSAGRYRILIQLPGMGVEESRLVEDMIRRAGRLRFCLVNSDEEDRATARQGRPVAGHTVYVVAERGPGGSPTRWRVARAEELVELTDQEAEGWLLVENETRVGGEDLADVGPTLAEGFPAIRIEFKGAGRRTFERLTEQYKGRRLAIILDRELYSAPLIKSRIAGAGTIEGRFSVQERDALIAILRAGKLPADIELEWNNTVGPQLGEDSIRNGLRACIVALILVVFFMAAYYLLTGVIADFALVLNLLLVLTLMTLMTKAVLTLPGIAGLVLTLGMAVDANVLINERIREEREKGKTLGLAIRTGYERAFITILDSNLTTLITALILLLVGTGPVKGFALTLSLGIVISMFTAIWVTRVIVDLLVENGWLHHLRMLGIIKKTSIPFTRIRHAAMIASAILIVFGLSMLARGWERVKDTDLTGGVRAEIELEKGVALGEFRERVANLFPQKSDVQAVWDPGVDQRAELPRRFSVRVRRLGDEQRHVKMKRDIEMMLEDRGLAGTLQTVQAAGKPQHYQFDLQVEEPLSEIGLRRQLTDIGYDDGTIRHIVLEDRKAGEFIIRLHPAVIGDEEDIRENTAKILDALSAAMEPMDVRVEVGRMQEDERSMPDFMEAPDERARTYHLPITLLTTRASRHAVREALVRQVPDIERSDEFRVVGYEEDAGAEMCNRVAVYGPAELLKKILDANPSSLLIRNFSRPIDSEIRIMTKLQYAEADIRGYLDSEADVLGNVVRGVIPIAIMGGQFRIAMEPLSEEKAIEQVKEDLLLEFRDELAQNRVNADIEPLTEDPEGVPNLEELKGEGYAFFMLRLDRPMQGQAIRNRLLRAGYRDALIREDWGAEAAAAEMSEVLLKLPDQPAEIQQAEEKIRFAFANPDPFRSIEAIGPVVAAEMANKAVMAIILSCVAIIFYIWFRFGEVKFGLAAVTALIHDVLMTAGAVGVADALSGTALGQALGFSDIKVNVTMIAAFLTLIGYSINDTIVVFDRIRENMGGARRRVDPSLVDASINQILSRTVLTTFTTFMVLMVLYVMGGPVVHGFAFVMTFGVLVGTYSSIFIASPIIIGWEHVLQRIRQGKTALLTRGS